MQPDRITYDEIPEHMRKGMKLYIEEGGQPGNFLYHILINDFVHAVGYGDIFNQNALLQYAIFLYNNLPVSAWGSKEKVDDWIALGGWKGLQAETEEQGEGPSKH